MFLYNAWRNIFHFHCFAAIRKIMIIYYRDNFSRLAGDFHWPPSSIPTYEYIDKQSYSAWVTRAPRLPLLQQSTGYIYSSREFRLFVYIITNRVFLQTSRPTCWHPIVVDNIITSTGVHGSRPTFQRAPEHTHTHIIYTHVA